MKGDGGGIRGVLGSESRSLGDGKDGRLVVVAFKPLHPLVLVGREVESFAVVAMVVVELKVLMTRSGSGRRASPFVVHRPARLNTRLSHELVNNFFSVIFLIGNE